MLRLNEERAIWVDFDGDTILEWPGVERHYYNTNNSGKHLNMYFCIGAYNASILLINTAVDAGFYLSIVSNLKHKGHRVVSLFFTHSQLI